MGRRITEAFSGQKDGVTERGRTVGCFYCSFAIRRKTEGRILFRKRSWFL